MCHSTGKQPELTEAEKSNVQSYASDPAIASIARSKTNAVKDLLKYIPPRQVNNYLCLMQAAVSDISFPDIFLALRWSPSVTIRKCLCPEYITMSI